VTLGLGAGAFGVLESKVGRSAATIGFVVWAGSWLTIVHSSMLYGFGVAIGGLLLALASALRLTETRGRGQVLLAGVVVVGIVVAMLMRPFDAWIGALVVGVSLVVATVRRRLPPVLVVGIVGTSFALWIGGMWARAVWSHGSLGSYLEALREQLGGAGTERGFDVRSFVLGFVGAESGSFREALPQWAVWLTVVGLVALVVMALVRRSFDWPLIGVGLGGGAAYAVFVVVFPFQGQGDKYLTWVAPFAAIAIAGSLALLDATTRHRWMVSFAAAAVMLVAAGGIGSADAFADRLVPRLEAGERVGVTMNTAAENEPCRGAARYNTPALQVGSGCSFSLVGSIERLEAWLAETDDDAIPRFVYWAGEPDELGFEDWVAVEGAEGLGYFLWLEQPDELD
jgi:hypothetical protein